MKDKIINAVAMDGTVRIIAGTTTNLVEKVREINGSTKPEKQKEGPIRKAYAKSITENSVHSSDSVEHAKEEIELWFPGL